MYSLDILFTKEIYTLEKISYKKDIAYSTGFNFNKLDNKILKYLLSDELLRDTSGNVSCYYDYIGNSFFEKHCFGIELIKQHGYFSLQINPSEVIPIFEMIGSVLFDECLHYYLFVDKTKKFKYSIQQLQRSWILIDYLRFRIFHVVYGDVFHGDTGIHYHDTYYQINK